MPLNNKDGSLPSTLGKGERRKKKKQKAVALALLSLKEWGEKPVF